MEAVEKEEEEEEDDEDIDEDDGPKYDDRVKSEDVGDGALGFLVTGWSPSASFVEHSSRRESDSRQDGLFARLPRPCSSFRGPGVDHTLSVEMGTRGGEDGGSRFGMGKGPVITERSILLRSVIDILIWQLFAIELFTF